ncbi:MAG: ribosome maturation factor RimP [Desulfobacterales bacterium]
MKARKHNLKKKAEFDSHRVSSVNKQKVVDQVTALAEPLCVSEGLELIHVEFQREPGGKILRLYLDKPGGISLNDCIDVSRQLGDILEVTSPGSDRPLVKQNDFEKFKGHRVKIRTIHSINGQKNFTGILLGKSGEQIHLQIDNQRATIPYQDIYRARLAK